MKKKLKTNLIISQLIYYVLAFLLLKPMKVIRLIKIALSKLSLYSILWIWLVTFLSIVLFARDRKYSSLEIYQTETMFNITEEEREYDYPLLDSINTKDDADRRYKHPVLVWWTDRDLIRNDTITCQNNYQCITFTNKTKPKHVDAYLIYGTAMDFFNLPLPRKPDSIIWAIAHEESPKYAPYLLAEKTLRMFNYSCTFSRWSDMPVTLQFMGSLSSITSDKYFVRTADKNAYLQGDLRIAPVVYIQSQCDTATDRNRYVEKLMEYIQVDSYGNCLKNNMLPTNLQGTYLGLLNTERYYEFLSKYKFMISIENAVCHDYITEKLWIPIRVGTVPLYFGSPTVRDWLPNNKSAILIEDFKTPKHLSEYIKSLLTNDELYEEHLEHKTKRIVRNMKLIKETNARPYETDHWYTNKKRFECYVCEKLHQNRSEVHIVDKRHFDCMKPISMLTKETTDYINMWNTADYLVDTVYDYIMTNNATTNKKA